MTSVEARSDAESVEPPRENRAVELSHRLEYAAIRSVVAGLGALGFRRASDLGARLGRLGYKPLGIRRGVVEKQLAAAFPEWNAQRVQSVSAAAYEHLGRTTIETAVLGNADPRAIHELFRPPEDWPVLERALSQRKGAILVAGHLGNWELAGCYFAARGVVIEAVARQMQNPLFDAYLTRTRTRLGVRVIWDGHAVRRVPRALRENHAVAFLMDQGAAGMASTWVPFFRRLAKTPRGPAVFALRLRTPVIFVAPLRNSDGTFSMHLEEVPVSVTGDRNADIDGIVEAYTAVLERWVRRSPEQYFWHHRRWKHQRPGTPKELGNPL